jgi:hypothetical protein
MPNNQYLLKTSIVKKHFFLTIAALVSCLALQAIPSRAQSTSVSSDAIGYYRVSLNPGFQTISVSLTNESLFTSYISSSTTATITSSYTAAQLGSIIDTTTTSYVKRYYVEITDGPNSVSDPFVGHRFEVDETLTDIANSNIITIDQSSLEAVHNTVATVPNLTGYQMELREHVRLGQIFPPASFVGSNKVAQADQLLIFNGSSYDVYYMFVAGSFKYWTKILGGLASEDDKPLYPSQGLLFNKLAGTAQVNLIVKGKVRANPFFQPLNVGFNLIAEGFPISASPVDRDAVPGNFTGSTSVNNADQVSVYNGSSYDTYYLLSFSTFNLWRKLGGSGDFTNSDIFEYNGAVFLKRQSADAGYRVPLSWQP